MSSQVQPHSNPLPCNGFTSAASFQSLPLQWLHKYSLIPILYPVMASQVQPHLHPYNAMTSQVQPHSNPLPCNDFTSTASFQSLTLQWLHKYSLIYTLTMQCLHKYSLIPIPYPAMASQVQPHSNPLPCNGFTSAASFQSLSLQWLHKCSLIPIPYFTGMIRRMLYKMTISA